MTTYIKEYQCSKEIVLQASKLTRLLQSQLQQHEITQKEDLSPVTVADLCAQVWIKAHLKRHFPHDPILGEEDESLSHLHLEHPLFQQIVAKLSAFDSSLTKDEMLHACKKEPLLHQERQWILDPIDGTRGFLKGEAYAVALALQENHQTKVGILGCPHLPYDNHTGLLLGAAKGSGTRLHLFGTDKEKKVFLSPSLPDQLLIYESQTYSRSHDHSQTYRLGRFLHPHPQLYRLDSQCKYAYVALGKAHLYIRFPIPTSTYKEKVWDHAAGALVLEEAGGIVTDLFGAPLDFSKGSSLRANHGLLASHPAYHQKALDTLHHLLK